MDMYTSSAELETVELGHQDGRVWKCEVSEAHMKGSICRQSDGAATGTWSARRVSKPSVLRQMSVYADSLLIWSGDKVRASSVDETLSFRQLAMSTGRVYFEISCEDPQCLQSLRFVSTSEMGAPHTADLAKSSSELPQVTPCVPPPVVRKDSDDWGGGAWGGDWGLTEKTKETEKDQGLESLLAAKVEEELTKRAAASFSLPDLVAGDVLGVLYDEAQNQVTLFQNGRLLSEKPLKAPKVPVFPEMVLKGKQLGSPEGPFPSCWFKVP